jgi:hypothetical protein
MNSIHTHFDDDNEQVYIVFKITGKTSLLNMEANDNHGGDEKEMLIKRNSSFRVLVDSIVVDPGEVKAIVGGGFPYKSLRRVRKIEVTDKRGVLTILCRLLSN